MYARRAAALALLLGAALLGATPHPTSPDRLVMFVQRGCPYCAAWDRDIGVTYAETDEGRELPLRRVDIAADRPADLRNLHNILVTPTFVLVHCGREFRRITGYIGEYQFWGLLDAAIKALHEAEHTAGSTCAPRPAAADAANRERR
jgi:hypothetical protein